ncbi:class II aldolase/adducin family protein [Scopulibacillus cellulosilyticus]|uniref:Class II aldolase/adducin family protein n=1 Tax=Scopulibacillus cellulosilyticus TaxID=2665665 RepID=A0ABW2Q760_9BACL
MVDQEKLLREQICDIGKRMYMKDMGAANDGNISIKLSDNVLLCTPTGVSKGYMSPEMICKIDGQGELIEKNVNDLKPSSEIKMHLRVYAERKDIHAVVHAHPLHATAFAVCGIPLNKQIMPESTIMLGEVPIAEYGTPSTEELPNSISPYLKDYDAILLANHGALTYGSDLNNAYFKMETMEYYAKLLFLTTKLPEPKELSDEQVKTLVKLREERYELSGRHPGLKLLKH